MDDRLTVADGSVSVRDGRIAAVGDVPTAARHGHRRPRRIPAPGIHPDPRSPLSNAVQGIRRRHASPRVAASARLADGSRALPVHAPCVGPARGEAELLRTGTTSVLTMETVHDTDVVFEALAEIGLRATVGKCMMDSDTEVPRRLQEQTRPSIDESLALKKRWHGAANGRLRAAFAPRFAVSCSRDLLEAVASLSASEQALVHTHASENRDEVEVVRPPVGRFLEPGVPRRHRAGDRSALRRALRLGHRLGAGAARRTPGEGDALPGVQSQARFGDRPVPRCGRADLGLARRGRCRVQQPAGHLRRDARCRHAQAVRKAPGALPAREVVWMATREGARALARSRNRIDRGRQEGGSDFARSRPPAPVPVGRSLVHCRLHARGGGDGRSWWTATCSSTTSS